jgi:hypothetical protein
MIAKPKFGEHCAIRIDCNIDLGHSDSPLSIQGIRKERTLRCFPAACTLPEFQNWAPEILQVRQQPGIAQHI